MTVRGNRITDPTTAASKAENERVTAITQPDNPMFQPGAFGWTPARFQAFAVAVVSGVLVAVGALIVSGGVITAKVVVATILTAIGVAIGDFFGVRSAGVRNVPANDNKEKRDAG